MAKGGIGRYDPAPGNVRGRTEESLRLKCLIHEEFKPLTRDQQTSSTSRHRRTCRGTDLIHQMVCAEETAVHDDKAKRTIDTEELTAEMHLTARNQTSADSTEIAAHEVPQARTTA